MGTVTQIRKHARPPDWWCSLWVAPKHPCLRLNVAVSEQVSSDKEQTCDKDATKKHQVFSGSTLGLCWVLGGSPLGLLWV